MEALVFKGLLLRLQALLEKDPASSAAADQGSDRLSDKANELRKQQATGVGN